MEKRQWEWLDLLVVLIAAFATLGLAIWMAEAPPAWEAIPRYLLILPVALFAYRFGWRWAFVASAVATLLLVISTVSAFSAVTSSSSFPPYLLEALLVAALLFLVGQLAALWGQRRGHLFAGASRRPSDRVEVLGMLSADISGGLDLSETLDAILSSTQQILLYDVAEITLWDEEGKRCVTQGWGGRRAYARETGGSYRIDEGYTGWIIRHRSPLLIPDVQAREDVRPKVDTPEYPFQSYIGIPLQSRGRFVGTLELASYQKELYTERDVELLQAVGSQAAVAVENAYLYAEARLWAERQAGLANIAALAGSSLEVNELLDRLMGEAIQLLDAEMGVLLLYDEAQEALVARYLVSARADRKKVERFKISTDSEGFEQSIFARGGSYFCNDPENDPNIIPAYLPHIRALDIQNFAGVAVRLKDRGIGELYLTNRSAGFDREEVRVMKAVAGYFATAIENGRLYEETRRRASELASLAEVSATVSESLDLEEVLRSITDAVREVVGCQRSSVFVLDENQNVLRLAMTLGYSERYEERSQVLTLERGGRAHAVATGKPLIVPDIMADDDLWPLAPLSAQENVRAFADLPLKRADRVIGMLSVAFANPHTFSDIEIELLTAFADQAAIAIHNARLYSHTDEELQHRVDALSSLQRVSQEINATLNLEHILDLVLEEALSLSKANYGAVALRDPESGELQLETCTGCQDGEREHIEAILQAPEEHPVLGDVLRTHQLVFEPDCTSRGEAVSFTCEAKSMVAVPIFYAETLAGLIILESVEVDGFSQELLTFAEGLAAQAAIAIGNARRYHEQLERGELLRRRADQLGSVLEVSRALRSDRPLKEILEEVAYGIQESVGFNVVLVSVLEGEPPYQRRVAAAGIPIPDFERIKEVRQPWSLVEEMMDEEYRISQSYYIPAEQQAKWRERLDIYTVNGADVGVEREPGRWHPSDMLLVPLVGPGGDVRGLLSVDQPRDGRVPDQRTVEALEIFAAQAALAIENAHMVEALQRRAEILALFNDISQSATAKLELDELLKDVVKTASDLLVCDHSSIFLLDVDSGLYLPRAVYERESGLKPETLFTSHRYAPGEGLVGRVAESGMPVVVDDLDEEDDSLGRPLVPVDPESAIKAFVLTPLTAGDQVVGVLCAGRQGPESFMPVEVAMLSALADQVAVAVENARLFEEAQQRAVRLEAASEVARGATAILDVDQLLDETVQLISDKFGFYHAGVFLVDEQGEYAILQSVSSEGGRRMLARGHKLAVGKVGIVGHVTGYGEPRIALDVGADAVFFDNPDMPETRSEMALPLISRGRVIGALDVQSKQEAAFTSEDVATLQTMADQLANAIENARLYEETTSRAERLAVVNRISRAAGSTLQLDDLLDTVYQEISSVFPADAFFIALYDEEADHLDFRLLVDEGERHPRVKRKLDGLSAVVVEEQEPLLIRDLAEERDILPAPPMQEGDVENVAASWLGVPMLVGDRVIGIINVQSYQSHAYSAEEQLLLSTIADQVAVAVDNARLFEEVRAFSQELELRVERRTEELADALEDLTEERDRVETLYRIASELSASLDLDYVLNKALALVVDAVEADRASTMMLDASSGQLIHRAACGADVKLSPGGDPVPFSRGEGLVGWVIEQREATIVSDIQQDSRWVEMGERDRAYRSALSVPLIVGDEVLGALLLLHAEPGHFREEHRRLVETAAVQVAHAINNAKLYSLIREQTEQMGGMLKAQRVEAAKSEAILEGVADGVMVTDSEGNVILFNAAAERILELPREDALGRATREMLGLYGSQAHDWMEMVTEWEEEPESYEEGDYLATRLDIEDRVVSVHLAPVFMGQELLGTVSVFRDITAEVEAEQAKVEFVSMVSHELRTPMTSIKGYVDMLLLGTAGGVTEEQKEFLSVIKSNVERLRTLVNELLDISRIESGRIMFSPQETQVEKVIDRVILSMKGRAREKELDLRSDIPSDLPAVHADADRVVQILTNLIGNACNYTPRGGEVVVCAHHHNSDVQISVRDTGIGISPEDQAKIFDRFFRADNPVVQDATGTGLGLSIVESLVAMHDGQIWVESEPGEGSTFTFTLPTQKAKMAEQNKIKVLIVEDDADVAQLMKMQLADDGREVLIARSGEAALETAQVEEPDLITLDILLPDMDGFDVLETLKSDPVTKEIPVIIVSIVPDRRQDGLRLGAVDYVTKPIDEQRLLGAMQKALVRRGTVLVVDDDEDTASFLCEILQARDFNTRSVTQGQQVLQLAREIQPTLILLDLHLPDVDGAVVLRWLKEEPETQEIPVIVITGSAIMDDTKRQKVLALGAARFVTKPFSFEELIDEIESVLPESLGQID